METINSFIKNNNITEKQFQIIDEYIRNLYGICLVDENGKINKLDFYSFNYINGAYYLNLQRLKDVNVFSELIKKGISIEQFILNYIENKIAETNLRPISKQSYFDFIVNCIQQEEDINALTEIKYFVESKTKYLYNHINEQITIEDLYKSGLPTNNFRILIENKIVKLKELVNKLNKIPDKDEVCKYNIEFIKSRIMTLTKFDFENANEEAKAISLKNTLKCGSNDFIESKLVYILEKSCINCLMIRLDNFSIEKINLDINEICNEVLIRLQPSNYSIEYDAAILIKIINILKPKQTFTIYDAMKIIIDYIEKEFIKTDEITSYYKNRKNRL